MIPVLPVEIIRLIVQLSLPCVVCSNLRKRSRILRPYTFVNTIWKRISQGEMIRHVLVGREAFIMLGKRIKQMKLDGDNPRVITARIDFESLDLDDVEEALKTILDLSPSLEALSVAAGDMFELLQLIGQLIRLLSLSPSL